MNKYFLVVDGYDSGLNELLKNQYSKYNPRTRKTIVNNSEKAKNDRLCRMAINSQLKNLKIKNPVYIHYKFFTKDLKRDNSNIASAFIKSFEDALQQKHVLQNDGAKDVVGFTTDFELKRGKNNVVWICIEELKLGTSKVPDVYDWRKVSNL